MSRQPIEPSNTFLTRDEIREMTGTTYRAKQIENLRINGVRFTINVAGWPVVARAAVEGAKNAPAPTKKREWSSSAPGARHGA